MAVMMELEHLQKSPADRWQYRWRVPKQQQDFEGIKTFKRVLVAKEGTALRREYCTVEAEFDRLVNRSPVPVALPPSKAISPRQQWDSAVGQANCLVALGAGGLDEDELREVLAEDLHRLGGKDLVVKALMVPMGGPPERTLQDAVRHYLEENLIDAKGNRGRNSVGAVDRVFARLAVRLSCTAGENQFSNSRH